LPELPDIELYLKALETRVVNVVLRDITINSPFLLRTVNPTADDLANRKLIALRRIGKRIAFEFDNRHWLVIHLMIAGRFQWTDADIRSTDVD